jgi:hypothetical protein
MFRRNRCDETILLSNETIFRFWRRYPETAVGYHTANETAVSLGSRTRSDQMRTASFILAFAFVLAGPSMAGSVDKDLPGAGTFAYNGAPVAASAPHALVVAAR